MPILDLLVAVLGVGAAFYTSYLLSPELFMFGFFDAAPLPETAYACPGGRYWVLEKRDCPKPENFTLDVALKLFFLQAQIIVEDGSLTNFFTARCK